MTKWVRQKIGLLRLKCRYFRRFFGTYFLNGKENKLLLSERKFTGFSQVLAFLLMILFSAPVLTFSAEWRVVPRIGLYGGYNSNVFFANNDKVDSYIVNVQPAIDLDYTSLLSELHFTADFDILRYLDESDLNRVNQFYDLEGLRQLGERWRARGSIRYIFDSTQNTYLEDTGRVIEILDREYLNAKAGVNYLLSRVSSIDTDYGYEKAKYEENIYPNYTRHRLNFRYKHRLKSERDILTIGPSFYHRINDLNDTDYVSIDVGWERDWSAITNSFASIGARYTTVDVDGGERENDWGTRARFNLTHEGVVSEITFRYYHDLKTTADGADVNVDNFYLSYFYKITARFGLGIDGRLIFSYDLFNESEEDDNSRYYELRPFANYRMTKNLLSYLRYSYQNSSQDLFGSDETKSRHRFWIEFKYAFPMML